jgi:hypothetical protein
MHSLQLWRQFTVIMAGRILIFVMLAHSVNFVCNPLLSGSAFYGIAFLLSLRLSLRSAFPDGSVYGIQCGPSLAIGSSAVWNIQGFSASRSPGIVYETCVSFLFLSLTQPYMNDWRF